MPKNKIRDLSIMHMIEYKIYGLRINFALGAKICQPAPTSDYVRESVVIKKTYRSTLRTYIVLI